MTHEQTGVGRRDVFVSYCSGDIAAADAVCGGLERAGMTCWVAPRDVLPGELYADAIVRALDASKVLVMIQSKISSASPHVIREVERAVSKGHPIISLRIDSAPLPSALEYFLNTSQWLDANDGDIAGALPKLIDAVRLHVQRAGTGEPYETIEPDRVPARVISGAANATTVRRAIGFGVTILLLLVSFLVIDRFSSSKRVEVDESVVHDAAPGVPFAGAIPTKSIAVLPFTDMSEKRDQEYLADGMAEEILNLLAKVPDLLVSARTSSFFFKGKAARVTDIARQLGVGHVLEGSIRRSGEHLRVTAQLVRAENGYHVWSETYDRELRDIFEVQDDIANAVAQALQIKLGGGELNRSKGGTQNLEAYQLYLRAQSEFDQGTNSSMDAAANYLEEASKIDPNYGMAWSLLANVWTFRAENGWVGATEGYERGRQLARHALVVSPNLAEAHGILQLVFMTLDRDWARAGAEARLALKVGPTDPIALHWAGMLAMTLGRWEDAERALGASLRRDPLNPWPLLTLGRTYYGAGRFEDSDATFRKLFEMAPDFAWLRTYRARTLLAEGKPEAALAMIQQETDDARRLTMLPIVLHAVGRQAEADEAQKAQIAKLTGIDAYTIAATYAYRGEHELALQWLERAYEEKSSGLLEILSEPMFRNDSRYDPFLRKLKLVE